MLWLVHILVGMIIGVTLKSPWLVIPIALISHFVLDAVPHWDGTFDKKAFKKKGTVKVSDIDILIKFIDVIASISLMAYFYYQSDKGILLLGAIMAIVPDMSKAGYLTGLKNTKGYMKYLKFHGDIQNETSMEHGLSIQTMLFLVSIILLINMVII